ncbi:helix-turn-helix domain-containing protein [Sulfobacillus harzensis]|uniref:Helix-turn-helix domain-containing protein n=1 Tax=Sulfobacillus harzensis TaxID=2729629 RepID=A0A7Y0L8D3_9FIRM|nr:helix-turn-helix domain-containing protein [Sulfobacillus harzensis]NMP24898.1 helix-turn-helix domain-containing protein [Sulfobacillus harzensis]
MMGEKLRQLRISRHLTQSAIAEQVHCDRSLLSRIERNEVTPSWDLLQALCNALGVPMEELLPSGPAPQLRDDLLVQRCLSLIAQGRTTEAQVLAASGWWERRDRPSDTTDRLFNVLVQSPSNEPDILSIILATMFRQAIAGAVNEEFFKHGFHIQRMLGERGELGASQILCSALIALNPGPTDAFRLTLSLGTTLFRKRDWHMAAAMYTRARDASGVTPSRTNRGRVFHGLGACELELGHLDSAYQWTQKACELYADEAPTLYHLALQNLGMIHVINGDRARAIRYLEPCVEFWTGQEDDVRVQEAYELIIAVEPAVCFRPIGRRH